MNIKKEKFGKINNDEIYEYTLSNSNKLSLSVITYGGIITKIMMSDRNGEEENITVNMKSLEEIIKARPFHGAIIGPVSGRISNGEYFDEDQRIKLTKNEEGNTLHGGLKGLDTKLWDATTENNEESVSLILKTKLLDGEDGFPGDINVVVRYTLNKENEIQIRYEATTNKRTLFNPTNHVYFNLSGNQDTNIGSHDLFIDAEFYAPTHEDDTPTGELKNVENTDFDLRKGNKLKNIFQSEDFEIKSKGGFDHPFVLNQNNEIPAVILIEGKSGRSVELFTDSESVVVYTHNHEQEPVSENKNEKKLAIHSGITLETQQLPDAVNHKYFGSIWLNPKEPFKSTTTFKFNIID